MISYQNFSNWTGPSVQTSTNNGSIGESAVQKAFSAIAYKMLAMIFA